MVILDYGVWGLGWGVGWLKTPKPPPRGLGLGRGPRGGSLKPGVGRASDPMWRAPIRFVVHFLFAFFNKLPSHVPTQAPPYPTDTSLTGWGRGGLNSTCQLMPPTQAPPYPHSLSPIRLHLNLESTSFH
ncbi:hypothetical protein Hanom_Chr11g01012811 [Helianthus anomalus]